MQNDYIDKYRKIFEGDYFIRNNAKVLYSNNAVFDGGGARVLIDYMLEELGQRKSVTILDWGCGTAIQWHKQCLLNNTKSLMNILGEKVQGFYRYDPAVEIYSQKPACSFDFVICSDVLEHVPNKYLEEFFYEINSYVKKDGIIFYSISTILSRNKFKDGENMHVNLKDPNEWVKILKKYSLSKIRVIFNGSHSY